MKRKILALTLIIFTFLCVSCGKDGGQLKTVTHADEAKAELTVYAYEGAAQDYFLLPNLGHAFITVKNISDKDLNVGRYILKPDMEVAVGKWGMGDHFGLWFNVETFYIKDNRYLGCVSLTRKIGGGAFPLIAEYIAKEDDWTPLGNCSKFAADVWDMTTDTDKFSIKGLTTPVKLADKIRGYAGYETERPIQNHGEMGYFLEDDTFKVYTPSEVAK